MKLKIPVAVFAVALALPGLAHAAKVRGVVVSIAPARHALVVASASGAVATLRVTAGQSAAIKLGTRVVATGTARPDGSFTTTRLVHSGRAAKARLRAVVVKVLRHRLLVAGGGSSFTIDLAGHARALAGAGPSLQPGDQVETEVELGAGASDAVSNSVQQVGQVPLIEFSGIVAALDAGSLQIASNGVTTTIELPAGVTLPAVVAVGAQVEVVAALSGSTLTLTTIKIEDTSPAAPPAQSSGSGSGSSQDSGQGVEVSDSGEAQAEGVVTAIAADSITIQPGDNAAPVTFAIPAGFTMPTVAVGDKVQLTGTSVAGTLTLSKIEVSNDSQDGQGDGQGGGSPGQVQAEGTVTAIASDSITIQPGDNAAPVTFAIPAGFSMPVVAVGDKVDAKGSSVSGTLTLAEIEVSSDGQSSSGSSSSSGSGDSSGSSSDSGSGSSTGSSSDSGTGN